MRLLSIRTLFPSLAKKSTAHRQPLRRFRLALEPLEDRRLLSATLYVANPAAWAITHDVAPPGLSAGDSVRYKGSGPTFTFGTNAFSSINDAVTAAAAHSGTTVYLEPGVYTEQVVISTPMTLTGAGNTSIIRAPTTPLAVEFTYALTGVPFTPVVTVENTKATVSNLEIDGNSQGTRQQLRLCRPGVLRR